MKEYRGLEEKREPDIEHTEDMVGCVTLFIGIMIVSAMIFVGFTIYRLFT